MTNRKKIVYASLLAVFFISSCYYDNEETGRRFNDNLQGSWISNDPTIYSGELVINNDRITIVDFNEKQTPPQLEGGDDAKRPFKGFTKGTALKGYSEKEKTVNKNSEEGKFFIEDAGLMRDGIPYTFYKTGNNLEDDFLRFNFGGRDEIMKKQKTE